MRILKSSLITSLIAGLLLAGLPLQDAFAQRGGGNRGSGGRGGEAGNRGGEGGSRSFNGGQGRGGNRSEGNRGPSAGPNRQQGNRSVSQGPRRESGREGSPRSVDGRRNMDADRSERSFSERNFQNDRTRDRNEGGNVVRGDRNRNDFDRQNRDRNDFDRSRYADRDRGNVNRNNWNSAFFGPRGAFGNAYLGRGGFGTYGNYGRGWGYGGWNGYGGYGLGYGRYGGYGFLPFLTGLGLGYGLGGYGLGYGGYGLGWGGFGPAHGGYYSPGYTQSVPQTITSDAERLPLPADEAAAATDFVVLGESEFRAGNYQAAMMAFRHALVDEPNNAGLMLLIAQCLFQTGQWTEAAGATELAMGALPESKWGTVVQNYTQLYGNIEDYTRQLKELENAVKQDPNSPALRFLVGYHFGYLGYPKQAVRELGKAVELEGRDPAARRLHDIFAAQIGAPTVGPVPQSLAAPSGTPAPSDER